MKVSVVIPCLDAAEHLGAAIRSVLNQHAPAAEIIVADNGSIDASRAIAASFGARVRLIDVPRPGAAAARLAGAEIATGDALMFLDADDLIAPDTLGALVAALAQAPGAIAACPWMRLLAVGDAWHVAPASCPPRRGFPDDLSAWLGGWYHPPAALLWSRAALERAGNWNPVLTVNDDGELMMRALAKGIKLVRSDGGTAFYRYAASGQSLSGTASTRPGLISRAHALASVADTLAEEAQLARYAKPLDMAWRAIGADAEKAGERDVADHVRAVRASLAAGTGRPPPPAMPERRRAVVPPDPVPATAESEDPLISVVIPTFNRAGTLPRAIDSVLAQDWPNLELLVVDDASTDDTAARVAAHPDPRVRLLRQRENQGVAAARNRGVAEARGRFIAFLDSDDEWLPGKLRRQMAAMADERVGIVITGVETVRADGSRAIDRAHERGWLFEAMLRRNLLHGGASNALIRREALAMVGGFDSTLPAIEDYDLWLRLTRFWAVESVAEPLARYWDDGEASGTETVRRSRHIAANRAARRMLFERYVHDLRRAGVDHLFLLDSARRELDMLGGESWRAVLDVARAVKRRPGAVKSWAWLVVALLPRPLQTAFRHASRVARRPFSRAAENGRAALG